MWVVKSNDNYVFVTDAGFVLEADYNDVVEGVIVGDRKFKLGPPMRWGEVEALRNVTLALQYAIDTAKEAGIMTSTAHNKNLAAILSYLEAAITVAVSMDVLDTQHWGGGNGD